MYNNNKYFIKRFLFGNNSENYESAVDLFTLLSFSLIAFTILFGLYNYESKTEFITTKNILQTIKYGGSIIHEIPEKTIILILTYENNRDYVYLINGSKPMKILYISYYNKSLWNLLENNLNIFKNSNDIQIIVNNSTSKINTEIFFQINRWLAIHNFNAIINFER